MTASLPRGRGITIVAALLTMLSVVALGASGSGASQQRAGVDTKLIGRFSQPVFVTGPPRSKGLLFVVEKAGRIVSVGRNGGRQTFLDISDRVDDEGERGLLSVAFAPDYAKSRRFYVYYVDDRGDIVIAEFRRSPKNPRRALAGSRRKVIRVPHREAPNHNGGQVQFGPDGYLYFAVGDGGGGGDPPENAQNLDVLLGKLMRIDPRRRNGRPYTVPDSNPFVGAPGRDEIYSYGLRNPYRFSFDRRGGDLLIGDVGQNRWEEVDWTSLAAARGANFGWDAYEGFGRFDDRDASPIPSGPVTAPIAQFSHGDGNCAITGGYVYRGPKVPSLRGRYVYADFCRGQIRSLIPALPRAQDDTPVGLPNVDAISSFGEDAKGNLYFASLSGGQVYELVGGR